MGVGRGFWDLLKPFSRTEGFDFLRDKKVAIDLSYWIVQQETAVKGKARNPHLRLTFFRTINLFSKLGAFPIFVVDGDPSPLKAKARIERFYRMSGIDPSGLPKGEDGVAVERNQRYEKCVRECLELLQLLGMPVLRASCEAEALCAQLDREGHVVACITADSDAFLFGAKCVIKCVRFNNKEPFECYHVSDIETGLGVKRNQLIAIALLVGNDFDLPGVPGIGVDTALPFVQLFHEDEILRRLPEVGKKGTPLLLGDFKSSTDGRVLDLVLDETLSKTRPPHCSHCGHPGTKVSHVKIACEYCKVNGYENCMHKPMWFKCECPDCIEGQKRKERKRQENWQVKVCTKIAAESDFPNNKIIDMYLSDNHRDLSENGAPSLSWKDPQTELLIDFLTYHQHWQPSYVRQRMLPLLSTIFLREMAANPKEALLLYGQYEFHSIQRVKIRYGHPFYLVNWKRACSSICDEIQTAPRTEHPDFLQPDSQEENESPDLLDDPNVPQVVIDDGHWFLTTDENMGLIEAAFPEKVDGFLQEKAAKELKSKRKKPSIVGEQSESPGTGSIQLSITEFYRSTKVLVQAKQGDSTKNLENCGEVVPGKSSKISTPDRNYSKSVRRRLLFG